MPKLTQQKKLFCMHYVTGMSQEKAAIKAGFSKNSAVVKGCQLMKEPEVKEYIAQIAQASAIRSNLDADYVLRHIMETLETAKGEGDHRAVLKATELLGKHLKLFTDVQEHKFDLTQMGRVMLRDESGNAMAIEFNVGQEPDDIKKIN